ncbi:DUF2188 domain-containing protein [bacterium]|nr:DUF2188 domain-containing protein [bacterium]
MNYHVVKKGDQWSAKKEGGEISSGLYNTQKEAEEAAKKFSSNNGGGEVRIHKPNGQIRDSDTVKPGNDPYPPKDTEH